MGLRTTIALAAICSDMQGLNLTYQILGETRNEAAVDVLIAALADKHATIRQLALKALLSRTEPRCAQAVLANWSKLQADDLSILRPRKKWMAESVGQALGSQGDQILTAIAATQTLGLTTVFPQLILLAESSADHEIRQRATDAVFAMVGPLGADARVDRDQATVRGPVLARLADSVNRFSMHRNTRLIDAFLLVSTWGDTYLRQMTSGSRREMDLICKQFLQSNEMGVMELLAGFIRRRNVDTRITQIIHSREDERFRDALLRKIGPEPSGTVLRNLNEMGLPKCCRGGEEMLESIAPEYRAPLIHAYVAAGRDCVQTLQLITATIERNGAGSGISAASLALSRCEIPDADFWLRAAVSVAEINEEETAADSGQRLLRRLISLLNHSDTGLVRGVRRVLRHLHADEMLPRFHSLRPRSRRRLGRVVMMIDSNAIQHVRDALRHPVLEHRLKAIATADAFAAVDLLSDSFQRIAHEDHQEARMLAAEAMGDATGVATLQLLQEMVDLPECPVRDIAIKALNRRQKSKSHTKKLDSHS